MLKELELNREECCVIGDTFFDIEAAKDAGIRKVFILNKDREKFAETSAEIFTNVNELKRHIQALL